MYKFRNKSILITGGTGSFGKSLLDTLLKKEFSFKKIAVFSRDELKQHDLQVLYPAKKYPTLRFFLGDIRDKDRLTFAVKEFDIVVHAAALKQVLPSEYNPFEFIKTNIIGTQNVVDACLSSNVQKAILLSTDKSVSPSNLYGATKLCAERIFINSHNIKGNRNIAFSVVRYGNVFGSRGSVLHEFFKQKDNGEFQITDLRMTRFHITLEQSVNFVINSILNCNGGEIFIPKIPSFYVKDLAKAISSNTKIIETGIRPGEKIHEELISKNESCAIIDKRNYYILHTNLGHVYNNQNNKEYNLDYSSDKNKKFLTVNQLKENIKYYYKKL